MNNDNSFPSTKMLPLTQNQTAIWLDEVLFPNSSMYHIGAYYEIKGAFEETVFVAALQKVIAENEAFGISVQTDGNGQPFQTVAPQLDYKLPLTPTPTVKKKKLQRASKRANISRLMGV